ncbi:hypothetical protein TNCV_2519811 [Trichonephila clavipes]|nr:hypothetical protein TNCV_2519811 [Trichonephila clavipes]
MARNVQEFFFIHQIELLPWSACSPVLSPIESVWPMLTQRLSRDTPPAAKPHQLWQYMEITWTVVPHEYIQISLILCRVASIIATNSGYSNTDFVIIRTSQVAVILISWSLCNMLSAK